MESIRTDHEKSLNAFICDIDMLKLAFYTGISRARRDRDEGGGCGYQKSLYSADLRV